MICLNSKKFKIERNQSCLCGSGFKFKKCCGPELKDPDYEEAYKAYKEERYNDALKIGRANLSKYLTWYYEHTLPLLEEDSRKADFLLNVDVEALSDLIDFLMFCYDKTEQFDKYVQLLDKFEKLIDDYRWRNKIIYQRAICVLHKHDEDEEKKIIELLKGSEKIDKIEDKEILQLFFSYNSNNLGFQEKMNFIERILKNETKPGVILQYKVVRGLELFLIGDREGALLEIKEAVKHYDMNLLEKYEQFELYILGNTIYDLGQIAENQKLFEDAINILKFIIEKNDLSNEGKAEIYKCIGRSYDSIHRWKDAIDSYLRSLDYKENATTKIYIARPLLALGQSSRALDYLNSIDYSKLRIDEKFDHSLQLAEVALELNEQEYINLAIEHLKGICPSHPYFRKVKDEIIIQLLEYLNSKAKVKDKKKVSEKIDGIQKCLILQPNIFGFGININEVLDKFLKKKK